MSERPLVQVGKPKLAIERVEGIGNALEERRALGKRLFLGLPTRLLIPATRGREHRADARPQLPLLVGFGEEAVRTLPECLDALLIGHPPRNQQHRNRRRSPITAQSLQQLDAIEVRHDDIRDDERGRRLHHRRQGLHAAARGVHVVFVGERPCQKLAQRGFILDKEDARFRRGRL